MKKILKLMLKYTLVLVCAMFGALSLVLVEDINVGGTLAFGSIGAGTLIWDTRF